MNIRKLKVLLSVAIFTIFATANADDVDPVVLPGTWSVDLRPTPDSEPYLQTLEINKVQGDRFSGSFYGTSFEDGIINSNWGVVYFAFTTADARTSYHHSGYLDGSNIFGRTHAPEREMLSIWTGKKAGD